MSHVVNSLLHVATFGLLGGSSPSAPAPPPPAPPPAPMPIQDQAATDAAIKKQSILAASQSGRQSTVLSQGLGSSGGDKLGG